MYVIGDLGIGEICAAVDPTARADDSFAAELRVRPDHRVFTDGHAFIDVGRVGILQSHAGPQPFFVDALAQSFFHKGELLSRIHTHYFTWVVDLQRFNDFSLRQSNRDDIWQIIFALLVSIFDRA